MRRTCERDFTRAFEPWPGGACRAGLLASGGQERARASDARGERVALRRRRRGIARLAVSDDGGTRSGRVTSGIGLIDGAEALRAESFVAVAGSARRDEGDRVTRQIGVTRETDGAIAARTCRACREGSVARSRVAARADEPRRAVGRFDTRASAGDGRRARSARRPARDRAMVRRFASVVRRARRADVAERGRLLTRRTRCGENTRISADARSALIARGAVRDGGRARSARRSGFAA